MTIIHASGICLVTEESSDEFVVRGLKSTNSVYTFSKAYVFGREVKLTKRESDILELLMLNPGRIFSREDILDELKDAGDVFDESVYQFIKRIRRKLFPNNKTAGSIFIETAHCIGYKISDRKLNPNN